MNNGNYTETLKQPGFFPFFCTQFLGAFNDNFLKIVVSFVALSMAGHGGDYYVELIAILFILPSALFSGYAGHLADVYSKRTILTSVKAAEIAIMVFSLAAFFYGDIRPMLGAVFLMGLHSAFFSPAKYGILPEMLPDKELSRGNGLLEMSTFMAIILGTSLGSAIFSLWKHDLPRIGYIMVAIALAGYFTSLRITRVLPSGANKSLNLNPFGEITDGWRRLRSERTLWLTVIGISYFWFLGALVNINILFFGKELLQLDEFHIGLLGTFLAIGIGIGSLAAGKLSGDHIELGLVPLGSVAMGFCLALVAWSAPSYPYTAAALVLLGFSAGLFAVPLNALLQQRSGKEEKGQLIATNNFVNTIGIAMAAVVHWLLKSPLELSSDTIILLIGLFTLAGTAAILYLLPDYFVRFVVWLLTNTLYRIRVVGEEFMPRQGPALLVCNHVSFVDALLVGAPLPRFVRFMLHREYYDLKSLNWFFRLMRSIPVSANNRRDIVDSLRRARSELENGHLVCIFAEGAISRTGRLLPFKRGFEKIVEGSSVPIIPVHLDQLWGSIFSFKDGKFFRKWPNLLPYPVTVSFGAPLPPTSTVAQVRNAILELESAAVESRRLAGDLLHTKFVEMAKRHWSRFCMADTIGNELTYGKALIAGLLFCRWLRNHTADEKMIGVILPASVGGALINIATLLAGKVPVNLNFTAGKDAMEAAIAACQIETIVTSRTFLEKANLEKIGGMVFVEDVRESFSSWVKLLTAIKAYVTPARWLNRRAHAKQRPGDLATVIFSSGSTGTPKGVMLSHHNIISNVEAIGQVIQFTSQDRIMGILPLFHSFGFTASIWLPFLTGFGAVYHANPNDAKTIGETVQKYRGTLLISTPTFYVSYWRRCSKEQFASLRYVIAGAEKLREQVAKGFQEKFGLTILEGYGCTELSPVVAVNTPDIVHDKEKQIGHKAGTVGQPLPGVAAKVIDPDSGETLSPGQAGLLLIKGPNVMLGYLNQQNLTEQTVRNGWYITGDIASIDDDGFITITDRLSRFSKIGGEMVPHMKIEEMVNQVLGSPASVVTAIPDEQRGERLVVFFAKNGISREELWDKLHNSELPKLWIPKRDDLHPIDEIPILGSGKADLKKLRALALEKTNA